MNTEPALPIVIEEWAVDVEIDEDGEWRADGATRGPDPDSELDPLDDDEALELVELAAIDDADDLG